MMEKGDLESIKGFTLIEVCIVTIISGLLFVSAYDLYSRYSRQGAFDTTIDNIQSVSVEIAAFRGKRNRYPCPSDRTLPSTDPNFGKEVGAAATKCTLPPGLVPGKCYSALAGITPAGTNGVGGLCMVACSFPTGNPDGSGTNPCGDKTGLTVGDGAGGNANAILIGGIPINTIRQTIGTDGKSANIMYDGWGSQIDYAVTYQLTNFNTYVYDHGAITVHDENGNDTADIVNNGHFGLISHGPDRIGAYTGSGQMTSICGSHVPQSYVNPIIPFPIGPGGDDENCANVPTYIQGIRNDSKTAQHYDDITYFGTVVTGGLWAQLIGSSDMQNINPGMVNVGTAAAPPAATVALNVGDPGGGNELGVLKAVNNTKAAQLCDFDGTDCFNISAITTGVTPCPVVAGVQQVMTGITTVAGVTSPTCAAPVFNAPATIADQSCPSGHWMTGLTTTGIIICQ